MESEHLSTRKLTTDSGITFILKHVKNDEKLKALSQQETSKKDSFFSNSFTKHTDIEVMGDYFFCDQQTSLFSGHRLLMAKEHGGKFITGRLRFLLDYIAKNRGITLAYDGNKNTSIKKYHFTCHELTQDVEIPIIKTCENRIIIGKKDDVSVGVIENIGRGTIVLKSQSAEKLAESFYELEKHIGVNYSDNKHPYINLLLWMENDSYCMLVLPRVVFKPAEYYDENNNWDTALNALEMAGIFLMTDHDEFIHVSAEFLMNISGEVSFNDKHTKEIAESLVE